MLLRAGQQWAYYFDGHGLMNILTPWLWLSVSVGGPRFESLTASWSIDFAFGANPKRRKRIEFRPPVPWERIERLQAGF